MGAAEFLAQSRRYAAAGDVRMAQLAAWAADVHTLEDLLWENGLGQAPDPAAQLAAIGDSVAASVDDAAQQLPEGPLTPGQIVEIARQAMVSTFDPSVHAMLTDRLGDLGHLGGLRGAAEPVPGRTLQRLAGRKGGELVAELQTAADDCTALATLLAAGGDDEAAARVTRQADAAALEAYLVLDALRSGDHTFATVDLRWDLATTSGGRLEQPRTAIAAAVSS